MRSNLVLFTRLFSCIYIWIELLPGSDISKLDLAIKMKTLAKNFITKFYEKIYACIGC